MAELFEAGRGRVLLFCWLGWVFDFYDLILFAFVKGSVAAELGLELAHDIVWIDAWTLGATAVGGFAFGRVADRIGRRRALTWSILLYSGGALATAFAEGYWSLLIARLVTGIGVGGEWGVGHAVVAEAYPARLRNRAASVLQAGTPVAIALAAAVGCFLAPHVGWRVCFALSGLPAALVFFARAAMPGDDRPPASEPGQVTRIIDLFRGRLAGPSAALLGLLALHMTGFWCTFAWLPTSLLKDHGASYAFVGTFQIGANAVHILADVSFGPLADRFGRRRTFTVLCLVFAAGLVAIAAGFETLSSDLTLFGFAMAAVGLGAGTWSCFGVLFAEIYPPSVRATAASGFYNLSRGVQLVTLPLLGWMFVWAETFAVALWVGAVTAVLSALLIWWVRVPEGSVDG